MADYILVEKSDGVAILTMNRPEQLNAMNNQLSTELHAAVIEASADAEIGCWTRATPCAAAGATRSARAPSPPSA